MAAFVPQAQPAGVGEEGVVVPIEIPAGYRRQRIARVVVAHTAGSLTDYHALVSTDPAMADPLQTIVHYHDIRPLQTVDDDNNGNGFAWAGAETRDWTDAAKPVYVELEAHGGGADNAFVLALYLDD